MPDDEKPRSAIHDLLMAGSELATLLEDWGVGTAQAQMVIDQVMADYVAELNRALRSAKDCLYGVHATTFMQQYDRLWRAKLAL
jgi:hypothetical protein